ncbi:DUF742 domain-containing protein [Amycolatopsis sp. MtRt-6]|uniref:DUF742 domain-containing protein n=1 Tax=Amycolatopsis sp. MtRt-6 TaxID=2792782 RepID=UPI001A8C092C|nr:DUF742 domain-containing protein [Amycolatopsis sp. MtRt-6]
MTREHLRREDPDRLYTVTGGRSRANESALDLVTLIVSEGDPVPGMQSEHVKILRLCRLPTALVEVASELGLPVSVVKILLCDLLDTGRVTARHPSPAPADTDLPDLETLKQVLVGLQKL